MAWCPLGFLSRDQSGGSAVIFTTNLAPARPVTGEAATSGSSRTPPRCWSPGAPHLAWIRRASRPS